MQCGSRKIEWTFSNIRIHGNLNMYHPRCKLLSSRANLGMDEPSYPQRILELLPGKGPPRMRLEVLLERNGLFSKTYSMTITLFYVCLVFLRLSVFLAIRTSFFARDHFLICRSRSVALFSSSWLSWYTNRTSSLQTVHLVSWPLLCLAERLDSSLV